MVKNGLHTSSHTSLNPIKSDGKLSLVEEKSSKPPGQPKFVRKAPQANTNQAANIGEDNVNAASICQRMLVDGYVQSYVDFYHLTHRLAAVPDESITTMINIPLKDLLFIRDQLVNAEVSRRRGNTISVYDAYNSLADFYVENKDMKTGFFFHEKCLEVAQLTNDIRAEMSANHSLGVINQLMANFDRARVHHEKHELLAVSMDVFEEVAKANAELYKVYLFLAEKFEQEGATELALDMFAKCLDSGKKSWNKSSEAEANGRIGSLLLNVGKVQESVPYLRQYSQLAADLGHAESRCRASTALALAYDQLGQQEKALAELTLVHSISEQAGDMFLQAQACRALGTLYSKVNRLDAAVTILLRHFSLLKTLVQNAMNEAAKNKKVGLAAANNTNAVKKADSAQTITAVDMDLARAYIGISKGNQMMGSYIHAIEFDLTSLLDWKLNRTEIVIAKSDEAPKAVATSEETERAAAQAAVGDQPIVASENEITE